MARTVDEWRGKSDDHRAPCGVQRNYRRSPGEELSIDTFLSMSMPEPNSGCWIWMGAINERFGYGAIRIGEKTARAHRAVMELVHGQTISSKVDVCHRCDVRSCINPDHLFLGSRKDNMIDCSRKGRVVVPMLMGEECPASKLSADQVRSIRQDLRSQRELGRVYGVDKGTIACIKNGKTWRSVV